VGDCEVFFRVRIGGEKMSTWCGDAAFGRSTTAHFTLLKPSLLRHLGSRHAPHRHHHHEDEGQGSAGVSSSSITHAIVAMTNIMN
jgi:hypothetical protein